MKLTLPKHVFTKRNRALLTELVRTDFKLRYQGSVLGYVWTLLKPLMMFTVIYIVFIHFLRFGSDIPHFAIYVLLGIIIWSFFTEMTTQSLMSIVARGDLIRKIKIPRWIIVVSASLSALINLALNLIVVGVFLLVNQVDITWNILWLPLNLLEIYVFALGASFFLAAAYVKFRDVGNIWDVVLQIGFYATPVIYSMTMITNELFQKILLMNPLAHAIQDARYNVVTQQTITANSLHNGGWYSLIPIVIVILTLAFGVWYFRKESKYFAENL